MKKTLILSQTTRDDYALLEWKKNGVNTDITLKERSKILRALRRVWIKFQLPFQSIWYGDWKKDFLNYDCILLHGTWLAEDIPHWMRLQAKKAGKDIKIIWWYWNTVVEADHPDRVSEQDCEKWSFDKEDCKKYGMHYNTQYYFKTFQLPIEKEKYDIYFLGTEGGRKKIIGELNTKFQNMGLKTDIHIVTDSIEENDPYRELLQVNKLSYQENLQHIAQSKAVLEILRDGQSGQSLRALECLFYHKKLITNDIRIMEYDYYHKDNIFIIGRDSLDELPNFLEKPCALISEKLIEKYDCRQWLERFGLDDGRKKAGGEDEIKS